MNTSIVTETQSTNEELPKMQDTPSTEPGILVVDDVQAPDSSIAAVTIEPNVEIVPVGVAQAKLEPSVRARKGPFIPPGFNHILADRSRTEGIKIENCVGFTQIPLGVAGPLTIHGENQKETVFAPLATVEATLVASCTRGCKVLQMCGGVNVAALSESMSRAPAFHFASVKNALAFYRLVPSLEGQFKVSAERTSKHARLTRITPYIIGTIVHVKFEYSCGDAAGQNMVTIATHTACQKFLASPSAGEAKVIGFQIDGQFSSDKKASWGNVMHGRGVEVLVWATLSNEVCRAVLGLDTAQMHRFYVICEQGALRNGQFGNNCNTSNILAAMFMACGQDVASVFEAGFSHGTAEYDYDTKDLTCSIYFPCMPVGTVGGGTGYATQREALELLNCFGTGKKWALAESIAAFALALELSTVGALANDTFTAAHERLARAVKEKAEVMAH